MIFIDFDITVKIHITINFLGIRVSGAGGEFASLPIACKMEYISNAICKGQFSDIIWQLEKRKLGHNLIGNYNRYL